MKKKDIAMIASSLGRVLRPQFSKRDAQIANLQQRLAALEQQLKKFSEAA